MANTIRKVSTQKASRFSIRVSRPLRRELSRKQLVLKTQRLVPSCLNNLSQRRTRSLLIRCNLGCQKSGGRNSVTRLIRRRKQFLHCVNSSISQNLCFDADHVCPEIFSFVPRKLWPRRDRTRDRRRPRCRR